MPEFLKNDINLGTTNSSVSCISSSPYWGTPHESQIEQSSLSSNLSFNYTALSEYCQNGNQFGLHVKDQDSSSIQSTDKSYAELATVAETKYLGKSMIPMKAVCSEPSVKVEEGQDVKALSIQDYPLPPLQHNYTQASPGFPFNYPDPLSVASYGPHIHMVNAQIATPHTRSLLPYGLTQDEPIYVNPKQYHAILRRRKNRAKLESLNNLKARKPYLHESRHRHALNRLRGPSGRFLNTKDIQVSKTELQSTTKLFEHKVHRPENLRCRSSTNTCPDTKSSYHQEHMFSVFTSHDVGNLQGRDGGISDHMQQYFPDLQ